MDKFIPPQKIMSKLPPFLPVVNIRDSSQGRRPSFNTSRRTSSAGSAVPTFALTLTESPSDSSSALDADQNSNNTLVSSIRNLKGSQISISMEVGETAVSLRSTGGAVVDEASPQQQQVASRRSSIFKKKLHSSDSIDSSLAADDDGESVASDKSSVSNWSSNRRGGGGERRRSAVIMESTLLAFQRRKSISLNTNNAEQVINRNDTSNSTSSTSDDSDGSTHSGSHTSLHSASLVGNHRTSIMSKEEREIGRLLQTALGKGVASRRASIILSRSSEYGTSARELIDGSSSAALHAPKKSVAKKLMNTLSLSGQRSIPQARYRWNLAIAFVMKSNRAMFLFGTREIYDSEYNKDKLPIVNSPTFSPHSFNFIIKSFETSSDLIVNTKIQVMLSASSKYRVSEDMLVLERLLSHRIHSLKKFTLEQRVKICHKMRYARYPQGKVVIKEGHKALSFYIILSGKVNIFKKLPDRIMHLNILNRGDSFGDVGIEGFLSRVRTATVVTACETELLVVDKEDYREVILSKNSEYDVAQRLRMIKNFPLIKSLNLDLSIIHQLVMKAETKVFEQGITIMSEGQMNGDIYIVVNGTISIRKAIKWYHSDSLKVSAMKTNKRAPVSRTDSRKKASSASSALPLITRQPPSTGLSARKSSISYRENNISEEPWSKLELEISCLQGGQIFPELVQPDMFPNTSVCSRSLDSPDNLLFTATEMSNQMDMEIKRKLTELDYEYPAYATVVTEAPTTCLVISRLDLLRVSPTILIRNIYESLDECYATEEEIKKEYIEKLEWETYKHGIVEDTCAEIKVAKGLQHEKEAIGKTRKLT